MKKFLSNLTIFLVSALGGRGCIGEMGVTTIGKFYLSPDYHLKSSSKFFDINTPKC